MDPTYERFLQQLKFRTRGRLAAEVPDPEWVFVGDPPSGGGYLVAAPPCRTEQEWRERVERD